MSKNKKEPKVKTFAQEYSRDFERLSYLIVCDELGENSIQNKQLTKEQKDGGYDAYFVLKGCESESLVILLEAKLRSDYNADLRLDEFSKSVLISINELAEKFYISTNLHFSDNTYKVLKTFSTRTGLTIRPIDILEIQKWINKNACKIKREKISSKFINELNKIQFNARSNVTGWLTNTEIIQNKIRIIDSNKRKKIFDELVYCLNKNKINILVEGLYGVGKTYFIESLLADKSNVVKLNLSVQDDYRGIFLSVLFQIWSITGITSDALTAETFDEVFKFCNISLLSNKDIANLKSLIFYNDNDRMDDFLLFIPQLENYLIKIFKPVLKRVDFYLYIYGLEDLNNEQAYNFLLHLISKFSGLLTIIIESDIDRNNSHKDSLFKHLDSLKFKKVKLDEWENVDAKEYLDYSGINYKSAAKIIKSFGCNAAVLNMAIKLKQINEYVAISEILKEYNDLSLRETYIKSIVSDILKFITQDNDELKEIFTIMGFFDGKYLAAQNTPKFTLLLDLTQKYDFIKFNGKNLFYVNKDVYLAAIKKTEFLPYNRVFELACEARSLITQYSSDYYFVMRKNFELACKIKDYNTIKEYYPKLSQYLISQGGYYQVREYLLTVYNIYLEQPDFFDAVKATHLLNLLVECYLNIADGNIGIDNYIEQCEDLIENNRSDWNGDDEKYNYDKAKLLKKKCGLSLRRGNYLDLISNADAGIDVLKNYKSERCIDLSYEFWNYKALGIKHSVNLRESIKVYKECLHAMKQVNQRLFRWYFSAKASFYTYRNPHKAYTFINAIYQNINKNSYRQVAHHQNNLGSLSLMCGDLKNAILHCNEALRISKDYYVTTEEARCKSLLGCIAWAENNLERAEEQFVGCIELFEKDPHQTHIWVPMINLSALYLELNDIRPAKTYAVKAEQLIRQYHFNQLKNLEEEDLLFSKSYIAMLYIVHVLWSANDEDALKEVLLKTSMPILSEHYKTYISKNKLQELLKNSHVMSFNHFMLKI